MSSYREKFIARLGEFDDHRFKSWLQASGAGELNLMDPLDLWNYRFFSYIRDTFVKGKDSTVSATLGISDLSWAIHYGNLLTMLEKVDKLVVALETTTSEVVLAEFFYEPEVSLKRIDDFMDNLLPLLERCEDGELLELSEWLFQRYYLNYRQAGKPAGQDRKLVRVRKLCTELWSSQTRAALEAYLASIEELATEAHPGEGGVPPEEIKEKLRALSLELMVDELWEERTSS